MIVAGLQTDIAWEDPEENFRRVAAAVERAVVTGARLLVLPEMFATGFSMSAERVAGWSTATSAFLADTARRHAVWVLGGFAAPGERRPRNVCALFDPGGSEALRYTKIHPFSHAGEDRCYEAGDAIATVAIEGLRVTPLICYDLRFPELFRVAARATDLFLVIANWPTARTAAWTLLLAARAAENLAYVLGVNRVGVGDGLEYGGDSALFAPTGECLASAGHHPDAVVGTVDGRRVADLRDRYAFLDDRRPELYAALDASGRSSRPPSGLIRDEDAVS
jgi:predicted amidohydrolase